LATQLGHRFGGYQAPTLSPQYFGIGLVVVLVVGLVAFRRELRLWLFAAVGVATIPLSQGLQFHTWTVWRLFAWLPLMENIIPSRFLLMTYLSAAVMLGVVIDRTHTAVAGWSASHRSGGGWRMAAGAAGAVVAAVALVPIAWYWSAGLPLTTQPVVLPAWFKTVAPHLSDHQVVLAFPVPFALFQSAMTWQAVDKMAYEQVGGGGPDALTERAGKEAAGQTVIGDLSTGSPNQTITDREVTAVRQALDGWGVTTVVIPDLSSLPLYERLPDVRTTAVLITAATGQVPIRQAHAWVWTGVQHAPPPVLPTAARSAECRPGSEEGTVASIERSTACILAGR
jgi:hypothetical protein